MEDFVLLKSKDMNMALEFLEKNYIINSSLIGSIQNYCLEGEYTNKKNSEYFGYFVEGELKGVFGFLNNYILIPYYEEEGVLNKIALLKTIKNHRPKCIMGARKQVEALWRLLEKTSKCINYDNCTMMVLREDRFSPLIHEERIIDARDYDFPKSIEFLIEVEKSFGRNPNTINTLKSKIYDKTQDGEHLYLLKNNKIVSQALIQVNTDKMCEIGGVFTLPAFRGKGLGRILVSELCKRIIDKNKIPYLIVSKGNESAKKLYNSLGFVKHDDYLIIEVQII